MLTKYVRQRLRSGYRQTKIPIKLRQDRRFPLGLSQYNHLGRVRFHPNNSAGIDKHADIK